MKDAPLALALSTLSFMLAVIWGGPLVRFLRHFRIGKLIRVEEPTSHMIKMGTPTMGGVMFILPVTMLTILLNAADLLGFGQGVLGQSVLVPLLVMLIFGAIGMIDDWEGVRGPRRGTGMSAIVKFGLQVAVATAVALVLKYLLHVPEMFWPGLKEPFSLGIWYIPIAVFIIAGSSNAVNFTDGLDGLAGLISATAFAAYGVVALIQGQDFIGRFCFSIVGALFGFLWFNVHPAELIMGDTGSLSIGATLGVVALMTGQWLLLPLIVFIPVSEAISVILQVVYSIATKGKRLFKMAPLHLHFELLGWSETQIVQRFWLVGLLFAMLAFAVVLA